MIRSLLTLLVLFSCAACWQHQGHRPTMSAAETWQSALDYRERGDVIAAEHLFERLRNEHSSSVFGILATLELRSWSGQGGLEEHVGDLRQNRPLTPISGCSPPVQLER